MGRLRRNGGRRCYCLPPELGAGGWMGMSVKILVLRRDCRMRANGVPASGRSDWRNTSSLPAPAISTQTSLAAARAA